MWKSMGLTGVIVFILMLLQNSANAQQRSKHAKFPDTSGFAEIESRLDDYKSIAKDITDKIYRSGSLDSIKQFASILDQISDTLINHMAPIFDSFNTLHPQQYIPVRNISDLSDDIIKTKDIAKARKYGQKMSIECANLIKAN